jgi:Mce-associated membrane protein
VAVLAVLTWNLAGSHQRARARAAAEAEVLAPAKAAAARILSYDYRHVRQDEAAAAGVLTGAFRGQYESVMRQQVVPQAPKQRAVVQAEVLAAGVSGVSADGRQAFVVVFANQTVSNSSTRQPRVDQVRVRLTLDRVGDRWLVSKVDAL